jgi:hypothetical protein
VAEKLLDYADVAPVVGEVGGERVSKAVAGRLFHHARLFESPVEGSLDSTLVQGTAASRVSVGPVGMHARKDPLPPPFDGGVWIPAGNRLGDMDAAQPPRQILCVLPLKPLEVLSQHGNQLLREQGAAILLPLSLTDHDLPTFEIDVLYAEPETLEDPKAGGVHQGDRQVRGAIEAPEDCGDLRGAQHYGQAMGTFGSNEIERRIQIAAENPAIQEEQRV